jgi:Domain of unknown function (DUF4263)
MPPNDDFDEEAAIGKLRIDTIYPSDFKDGSGKYLNIVTEEDNNTSVEYLSPFPSRNRIKITVTFLRHPGDIKEVTVKKFKQYRTRGLVRWEEQSWGPTDPMTFSHLTFEKLLGFLDVLTQLDLAKLDSRRIPIRDIVESGLDAKGLAKIRSLLNQAEGLSIIEETLRNGSITSRDLVNIGYRKNQLEIFGRLLREPADIDWYRAEHGIASQQPEKIWQHFFRHNEWIFGFGLDYRFLKILQQEAHVSDEDLAGRDGADVDFLMGATNFTVLVELKRPDTQLFEKRRNRAGSWKLSNELIDAVSQILEQKASWQVKGNANAMKNFDANGKLIRQRTADPKSILIVGSSDQFAGKENDTEIKLRTFELFRRDSRNIEILTYDELYERANFIVGHSESPVEEQPKISKKLP